MNLDTLQSLASDWRAAAELLRAYGAAGQAVALERCAAELEARLRQLLEAGA